MFVNEAETYKCGERPDFWRIYGRRHPPKIGGTPAFRGLFFPCNAHIGVMLKSGRIGGDASPPRPPRWRSPCILITHSHFQTQHSTHADDQARHYLLLTHHCHMLLTMAIIQSGSHVLEELFRALL